MRYFFLLCFVTAWCAAFAQEDVVASPPPPKKKFHLPFDHGILRHGSAHTHGLGPVVYGDFLYWTSQIDGLDLAIKTGPNRTSIVQLDFQWDPGFRVGVGYFLDIIDWEFDLTWTRFRSEASKKETGTLTSLWTQTNASSISGRFDFHYDTLDLRLYPAYFRYRLFAFQPQIGVRGAWIDWNYTLRHANEKNFNANDYHAIGLLAGVKLRWIMKWGLHIYGEALASVLYGQFHLKQTRLDEKFWRVRSNVHLGGGLAWSRFFRGHTMRLLLHAGYEFLTWFNQNQLYRAIDLTPVIDRGDLGINGLNIGAGLEF